MAAGDWSLGTLTINDAVHYIVSPPLGGGGFSQQGLSVPSAPQDVMRLALARREGSIATLRRSTETQLPLSGVVFSTTSAADCESALDALAKTLNNGVQTHKRGYQDERYWNVQLLGDFKPLKIHSQLYEYSVVLLAVDAFAYALAASSLAPGAVTLSLT